jgi:hypothetical protein
MCVFLLFSYCFPIVLRMFCKYRTIILYGKSINKWQSDSFDALTEWEYYKREKNDVALSYQKDDAIEKKAGRDIAEKTMAEYHKVLLKERILRLFAGRFFQDAFQQYNRISSIDNPISRGHVIKITIRLKNNKIIFFYRKKNVIITKEIILLTLYLKSKIVNHDLHVRRN